MGGVLHDRTPEACARAMVSGVMLRCRCEGEVAPVAASAGITLWYGRGKAGREGGRCGVGGW